MATAAKTTIVEVSQLVPLGDLDPETIITPGIFVQRVFSLEKPDCRTTRLRSPRCKKLTRDEVS